MKGHTMKCTFEHRECSVFFSSSALAHCRCLVSITASLKLNQGGSSKVSVETKTKPNQTSAPQIEPGGGSRRRLPSEPKPNLHPTHQPASHRALFSRKLPKYFVGRKIFFHQENCGCSDCSEFGFHWRLTQVSLSFAWDTVHTNNHKKKTNKKDECQISK